MDEDLRETLAEAAEIYDAWYSVDGIDESHGRGMMLLAQLGYYDATHCIELGLAADGDQAVCRLASLLFAAFQMGRASV